jgi:DNA-binding GntR family transcriptional regulator
MLSSAHQRDNISGDLCHLIRQQIADGYLPAGKHVNEVHLAEQLNVSRTPLREALSQLTAEGLLECKPRRGFFTKRLSVDEVSQLYPLRAYLDPQALRMAGLPDSGRIAELRRINNQIANAQGRPSRAIDLDDQWHRLLLADCPNEILLGFIDRLIWQSRRYEYAYLMQANNIEMATSEHESILAALESGDLTGACNILKQNMTSAREPILDWLQSRESEE